MDITRLLTRQWCMLLLMLWSQQVSRNVILKIASQIKHHTCGNEAEYGRLHMGQTSVSVDRKTNDTMAGVHVAGVHA